MLRVLVLSAGAVALQPRSQTTLDALKTSRRQLLPLAGFLFAPPAYAASSEERAAVRIPTMPSISRSAETHNVFNRRAVPRPRPPLAGSRP